jgi:hypothetical protein
MPVDTDPGGEAPTRDYDGLFKSLLQAHPEDTLRVLFGAELAGHEVILEGPTEQQRRLTRTMDKVFLVRRDEREQDRAKKEGRPIPLHDVYHVEIQVNRTPDFEERMVSYWSSVALRYNKQRHRIHQLVLWPLGDGYIGNFRRDGLQLEYDSINVPDGLDLKQVLSSYLAPLALWSENAPPGAVEQVADAIMATADPDQQLVLIEMGKLGSETLAVQLIEALVRRGMSDILEQTAVGRDIARRNHEEGREQGHVDSMALLLKHSYGPIDDLAELARKLVATDHEQHLEWVMNKVPLEQLRSA